MCLSRWITMVCCMMLAGSGAIACPGLAQDSSKPQPTVLFHDGGSNGRLESLFIPPMANAPFSLTLVTEWSRPMNGGGTFTLTNQRRIVRDGKGRIYQERWLLVPRGSKIESHMELIQISDPALHVWYNCDVQEKVCDKLEYEGSTSTIYKPTLSESGPVRNGTGYLRHEDLGVSNSNGVNTTGYRDTITFDTGVFGNDQPMITTREFWYSPQLGINLISTLEDPQNGKEVFRVMNLTTSEPDPAQFEVPQGYRVMDRTGEGSGSDH